MKPRGNAARGLVSACALLVLVANSLNVQGQETAPYPNGTSGLLAGTVPPPGHYWLMYNRLYTADVLKSPDGGVATAADGGPLGLDFEALANVHRFIYVTDKKIWGADYAWNFVVPFVAIDAQIASAGIDDVDFKIGDMNVEPFVMEWHKPRYDFGFVYGFFSPTAHRSDTRPSLPGKDFWTNYAGLAGTYYLDEERTWSASILSRYEVPTKRMHKDITPGNNLSFEWGIGKTFQETSTFGVSGYCSWQTTLDRGSDVTYPNVLDHVYGIGPEVQYFSPEHKVGFHFRYWWEFDARDRPEGTIMTLTLVKPF